MSTIERIISPFIHQQFPSFYKDQGPNFIAFVKAYYEWLEQSNRAIGHSRSLLDYKDIDATTDQFIKYFKYELMAGIPENIVADKRLLMKHITDLYRAKGSKRAYELLFRILYGEDVELFYPGEYVFKLSDNTWRVPQYLEITNAPNLGKLINTRIQTVGETATAIVENVSSRISEGREISVIEISQITGSFVVGDTIYQSDLSFIKPTDNIQVQGSLNSVIITAGGIGYQVGDILNVVGAGFDGQARVSNVSNNFLGSVSFSIINGGSGYTTNASVTVLPTLNFDISNLQGVLSFGDDVQNSSNTATGIVQAANSTLVQLTNFSNPGLFIAGDSLIGPAGNAIIQRVFGGTGSNASFKVGSLGNKEIITINSTLIQGYLNLELDTNSNGFQISVTSVSGTFGSNDTVTSTANVLYLEGAVITPTAIANGESLSNNSLGISGLYVYRSDEALVYCTGSESNLTNANLVAGVFLQSNTTGSVFELSIDPVKASTISTGLVSSSNTTDLVLSNVNGYFVETSTITSSNSGATATISDIIRLTDWNLLDSIAALDNLDTIISESLPLSTLEIGTITSLTAINPGTGYFTKPIVRVTEPKVINLLLFDDQNNQKGNNAIIQTSLIGGNGTITTVEITNSGYAYENGQSVTLVSPNNSTQVVGAAILDGLGRGPGRWLNRKSFISDVMKIHDNFFYQDYSYQIIAQRVLSSYEKLVRDLVHPAGLALFGTYRLDRTMHDDSDTIIETTISQTV